MKTPAGVAPVIMSLYPRLDAGQLELIGSLEGPTLGVAGPGAGKTLTLALRGANILFRGLARPEELLLCTYNADAAGELRQRFDAVASAADHGVSAGRTRVCTIHSLCARLLAEHPERVGLRRGFRLLDGDQQSNLLLQRFDDVFGPDLRELEGRGWRRPPAVVKIALKYFERICDEVINPRDLTRSRSSFIAAVGRCYRRYERLLLDENAADFAHLQAWADLLLDDDDVAGEISGGVRYLMCDEYQDTSHVQERILTRVSEAHGNLCVVGDEDQSLYRFRGATVRNILAFARHFPDCRVVELTVNYRSHPDIVGAYDRWMGSADWSNPDPAGPPFRHAKTIIPHEPWRHEDYPAVIAIDGQDPDDEGRQLGALLRFLKGCGVIGSYHQVALLLHSVQDEVAGPYLDALNDAGIPARCVPAGAGRRMRGRRHTSEELTITTIHQSKGRQWPVVIVGSLDFHQPNVDPVGRSLAPYFLRPDAEPAPRIATFDHMRQHYVALSRAERLLVLTAGGPVHQRFGDIWNGARRWRELSRRDLEALARQQFEPREKVPTREAAPTAGRVTLRLTGVDVVLGRAPF